MKNLHPKHGLVVASSLACHPATTITEKILQSEGQDYSWLGSQYYAYSDMALRRTKHLPSHLPAVGEMEVIKMICKRCGKELYPTDWFYDWRNRKWRCDCGWVYVEEVGENEKGN